MIHQNRQWNVTTIATVEELANLLNEDHCWTGCTGFRLADSGLLFLSDSFGGGIQEFGVVLEATGEQVESVTFGWMSESWALDLLRRYQETPPAEHCGNVDPARWTLHSSPCGECA